MSVATEREAPGLPDMVRDQNFEPSSGYCCAVGSHMMFECKAVLVRVLLLFACLAPYGLLLLGIFYNN